MTLFREDGCAGELELTLAPGQRATATLQVRPQ
jgi:hypothetical protein